MDDSEGELELPGTSVDEWDVSNCHLIRGDSEGMETRVLAGAVDTIDKNRPLPYLETNNRLSLPALIEQILSLAYLAHYSVLPTR